MNEKPPKRPVETPAVWLRFADENLAVAEREMTYDMPGFHTVCFLCQSAAEKYLKGYLIAQGWSPERTHDVTFAELLEKGSILNEYIVAGRYPGDLAHERLGQAEAEEAVEIVCQIKAQVMQGMADKST